MLSLHHRARPPSHSGYPARRRFLMALTARTHRDRSYGEGGHKRAWGRARSETRVGGGTRGWSPAAVPRGSQRPSPGRVTGSFPVRQRRGAIRRSPGVCGPAAAGHRGRARRGVRGVQSGHGPRARRDRVGSRPEAAGEMRERRLRAHGKRGVTEGAGRAALAPGAARPAGRGAGGGGAALCARRGGGRWDPGGAGPRDIDSSARRRAGSLP